MKQGRLWTRRTRFLVAVFVVLFVVVFAIQHGEDLYLYVTDRPAYLVARMHQQASGVSNLDHQLHSAETLGPEAVPALVDALANNAKWSAKAYELLTRLAPQSIPQLTDLLESPDVGIRIKALQALGGVGIAADSAIPAIRTAQKDSDSSVRQEAILALERICLDPADFKSLDQVHTDPMSGLEVRPSYRISPRSDDLLEGLCDAIRDKHLSVREAAARCMSRMELSDPKLVPILIGALEIETASYFPAPVVRVLGEAGSLATNGLSSALRHDNPSVRRYAVSALSYMQSEAREAIPSLVVALDDSDPTVRMRTVGCFLHFGADGKAAVPKLLSMLGDADPSVRLSAAMGLGGIGPDAKAASRRLVEMVEDGQSDPKNYVVEYAINALGKIQAEDAVPVLLKGLTNDRVDVRWSSIWALGGIGTRDPLVLEGLMNCVDDADARVRAASVLTLARLVPKPAVAVPDLIKALEDPHSYVRTAAAMGLARFGRDAQLATDALNRALRDDKNSAPNGQLTGATPQFLIRLANVSPKQKMEEALHEIGAQN